MIYLTNFDWTNKSNIFHIEKQSGNWQGWVGLQWDLRTLFILGSFSEKEKNHTENWDSFPEFGVLYETKQIQQLFTVGEWRCKSRDFVFLILDRYFMFHQPCQEISSSCFSWVFPCEMEKPNLTHRFRGGIGSFWSCLCLVTKSENPSRTYKLYKKDRTAPTEGGNIPRLGLRVQW